MRCLALKSHICGETRLQPINHALYGFVRGWHASAISTPFSRVQAGIQVGNACWELYCLEHGYGGAMGWVGGRAEGV